MLIESAITFLYHWIWTISSFILFFKTCFLVLLTSCNRLYSAFHFLIQNYVTVLSVLTRMQLPIWMKSLRLLNAIWIAVISHWSEDQRIHYLHHSLVLLISSTSIFASSKTAHLLVLMHPLLILLLVQVFWNSLTNTPWPSLTTMSSFQVTFYPSCISITSCSCTLLMHKL